ncbi:MAG: hypothetical protein ACK5OQ_05055, partial [Burkholderiales bacterium]
MSRSVIVLLGDRPHYRYRFQSRDGQLARVPCESPSSARVAGAVREQCLRASTAIKPNRLLHYEPEFCEWPAALSSKGQPEGAANRVAFSLVSFIWRSKRKKLAAGQSPALMAKQRGRPPASVIEYRQPYFEQRKLMKWTPPTCNGIEVPKWKCHQPPKVGGGVMKEIKVIGLDLAKNVFQ